MTNITTSANAEFAIGTTASIDTTDSTTAITDFETDSYEIVGEVESIPAFGDQVSAVNFTALSDNRVRKLKGSRDAGTIDLTVAFKVGDAGQVALKDALDDETQDDYNFRVEINDGTSAGSNTQVYFFGKVMSRSVEVGSADNVIRATVQVAINSAIYQVDGS